jgi:predicted MFS family arabinose efflux permease
VPRRPALPAALHERDFRLLFGAQATSLLGDQMVSVALAFGVLERGGSASDLGLVFAARSVALIACLLGGGVIGDRLPRRLVLVTTDLVRLVSQGALAAVLIAGGSSIWPIAALSALTGAANGVFNPTATGFLPAVVSPARLQEANALRSLASSAGRIAGPLLAGLLVATAGAGWALAVDAATYAVSAALVLAIRVPGRRAAHAPPAAGFLVDLRAGWAAFRSRTWLWTIVAWAAVGNVVLGAWRVLGPVVAEHDLGGVGAWSAILAASGVGGVIGGIVALRVAPRRPLVFAVVALALFYLPTALLAAVAPTAVIAVGTAVGEAGLVLCLTVWESTLQRHVEPYLLARVSAYDWLGSMAFEPVGLALWGPVAALIGISNALWLATAAGVLSLAAILAVRDVRTLPAHPRAAVAATGA